MEQHIFILQLIIEGATEKVSQFIAPMKEIYNKNIHLGIGGCIFECYSKI
jgi:hypothetical protein